MGAKPATTTTQGTTSNTTSANGTNWQDLLSGYINSQNGTSANAATGQTTQQGTTQQQTGQTSQANTQQATNQQATTNQQQNRDPWAAADPGLRQAIQQTMAMGGSAQDAFRRYTSDTTNAGLGRMEGLANQTSAAEGALNPVVQGSGQGFGAGLGLLSQNASGANLNGNPYMAAALKNANQATVDQVNSQFEGAGRYGSGAHTKALADAVGRQNTDAYMQNYNQERGAQNQAANTLYGGGFQGAGMAGQIDQSRQGQAQSLMQAGAARDAIGQQNQMAGLQGADWYRNAMLGLGAAGSSGTTTGTTAQTGQVTGQQTGTQTGTQTGSSTQNGTTANASSGATTQNATQAGYQNQNGGSTQNGTQTGTTSGTSRTVQPSNPLGTIVGAGMAGLGLLSGNPMALANIGGNLGGLFGGGNAMMAGDPMAPATGGGDVMSPGMLGGGVAPGAAPVFGSQTEGLPGLLGKGQPGYKMPVDPGGWMNNGFGMGFGG